MKNSADKSVDPELWHACAGGTVEIPEANTRVFYFPQGHAEHAFGHVDFGVLPRIPPMIPCRVAYVKFLADPETDEVHARIGLIPLRNNDAVGFDDEGDTGSKMSESIEKPTSFAKTLTQSDANNGGGFSVPRYCAETIFPRLDYTADPPVQKVVAKDIHGDSWKFRHIYRGTPRRHLLTTGWSAFVNHKKLVAGDSIVFLRSEDGDLCIGLRRAKKECAGLGGYGASSLWDYETKLSPRNACNGKMRDRGRVKPETVLEAAFMAANGHPFEIIYYPRAGTPEFCIKASSVRNAMATQWRQGIRFKMAFESEDSSRISWFMGTVASVQFSDPKKWPNSPWRLLQVIWDEPDLLHNVKCVSPWLVEVVSSIPLLSIPPLPSQRNRLRFLHPMDFTLDGRFPMPSFFGNTLRLSSSICCLPDNIAAGIQGARQSKLGVPFSDLHNRNEMQMELFPQRQCKASCISEDAEDEDISCLLSMGHNPDRKWEKQEEGRRTHFVLFGQVILTEEQMSRDHQQGSESPSPSMPEGTSSGDKWRTEVSTPVAMELEKKGLDDATELGLDAPPGICKVFMGPQDVGRTLHLYDLGSYEELYETLKHMLEIDRSDIIGHLLYLDASGGAKQVGEEPFSDFTMSATRLMLLTKTSTAASGAKRKLIADFPTAEPRMLGSSSSNQAGPFSAVA